MAIPTATTLSAGSISCLPCETMSEWTARDIAPDSLFRVKSFEISADNCLGLVMDKLNRSSLKILNSVLNHDCNKLRRHVIVD